MQTIAFIGGGNMAEALFSGLLKSGHPADKIAVSDPLPARLELLSRTYGVKTHTSNKVAVSGADVVVFSVKPQQMKAVLTEMTAFFSADMTLISIAAGVDTAAIKTMLGRDDLALVRAMPNTPAMVGAGMSVLFSDADDNHKQRAAYVMDACGETAWVDQEPLLHAVTAISGSGPAYFFLLAELMYGAAENLKLPTEIAEKIIRQTAYGAGMMLKQSEKTAAQLRTQVTSPNGTTQAALDKMYEMNIHEAVRQGVVAAAKRSKDMMR
ncbi:MAG: pyrroline-5-carboxylate reductase [Zetaproteobacteria bacterium CG1_02_49_23]|nr:MAG: pyrroline-5-carboxylate reductase [Zetaproteobacteria bacterium CG1_02_49_23]